MSYQANVLNVMIASPSDVIRERIIVPEVIHEWNALHAERSKLVLMPILWELDTYPATGDRAQAFINRQLVDRADALIAVFWTRLGTPTGKEVSGTVEEVRRMIDKGKHVMIYHSAAPAVPTAIDPQQFENLRAFIKEMQPKGLLWQYDNPETFRKQLYQHLTRWAGDLPLDATASGLGPGTLDAIAPTLKDAESDGTLPTTRVRLSAEAATLLLLAAADQGGGHLMVVATFGGTHIQAGQKRVNKLNDRRSEAKWKAAVDDLVGYGLLKDVGYKGEVFEVTYEGYKVVDQLKAQGIQPIPPDSE